MMTGKVTVNRLLLPALIAVFAIIAAVGAGISPTDRAEAATTQLTVGIDMKTTKTASGTYNINSLPTFEQCVDVNTSVNSIFYVDIFILNATGVLAFNADLVYDPGEITFLGASVGTTATPLFLGSSASNFSRNITSSTPAPPNEDNNLNPVVNDGTMYTTGIDTGGNHTGHGVLARLKVQALAVANVTDFKFSTTTSHGVTLTADPGATHPGDTTGDGIFDGPFINAIGKVAVNQPDGDGDTVSNTCDNCPSNSNLDQLNTDGDSMGNVCDPDDDNDGIADASDNCPLVANPTQDPTACQDSDGDGVLDGLDNCPSIANANQANNDNDTLGDVCDTDDDNDGVLDASDNCPLVSNTSQANWNGNALGDACEDSDLDNWLDAADNCKSLANPSQSNSDGDDFGDTCDNCPVKANNTQADVDSDFIGDACDDSDADTWTDEIELFTGTNRTQKCALNTGSHNENPDPSPPDTNDDQRYNTLDLVPYVAALNSIGPNPPYTQRLDFDMNNRINTLDLVAFVTILNTFCV